MLHIYPATSLPNFYAGGINCDGYGIACLLEAPVGAEREGGSMMHLRSSE